MIGTLYTIAAPSGAGKTSLVNALVDSLPNLAVSISHTTRPRRPNETNGVDYFFINETQFTDLIEERRFLEHAIVFGNRYGTTKAWVESQLHKGIDVILEIDWQGSRQVRMAIPHHHRGIFILPPSIEALQHRLDGRGQDKPDVIADRMAKARSEMSHYHEYDYVIINDNFSEALLDLQAVIRSRRLKQEYQQSHHKDLLNELVG